MHVILFNRISSGSNSLSVYDMCETGEEAAGIIREAYATYTLDKGFDPQFSRLDDECAFIGSYDMSDYIIMLDVDLDDVVGIVVNPYLEFANFMKRAGMLDA